jgi:hypothetical protein
MRRLIAWNIVTLDGFFAAPDGNLDWFVFDDDLERYIKETQPEAGALLFGRVLRSFSDMPESRLRSSFSAACLRQRA